MKVLALAILLSALGGLVYMTVQSFHVQEGAATANISLCRTDAELAKLPKDTLSQQRCAEPPPFGG